MFQDIKFKHIISATLLMVSFAENEGDITFLIDNDVNCKSTSSALTEMNCADWKKIMISTGNNVIKCKRDESINIKTGDPFYKCGPTILREQYKKIVTTLNFRKNDNEEIIGIDVLVHHNQSYVITSEGKIAVWFLIASIIGIVLCIYLFDPPYDNTIDSGDIALWWLLTDNSSCHNDWESKSDTSSFGFNYCS